VRQSWLDSNYVAAPYASTYANEFMTLLPKGMSGIFVISENQGGFIEQTGACAPGSVEKATRTVNGVLWRLCTTTPNSAADPNYQRTMDATWANPAITGVCLKRKIRNYAEMVKGDATGYRIHIKEGTPLNQNHVEAYQVVPGLEPGKKANLAGVNEARRWMCANFFDVRTFGAVMTTGDNCGQVRGPVQINFSRSIDPIVQQEVTITRQAVTRIEDIDNERTMGRKHIVPYGLYRAEGYVSAKLANDGAKGTGFSEADLELLWDALINLFEHDHSAARGKMATCKLIVFKHDSELGNAPSYLLFDRVKVKRKPGVDVPRRFADYDVSIDTDKKPEGISIIEKL
jgi:CRISPR-associated protein Csd2